MTYLENISHQNGISADYEDSSRFLLLPTGISALDRSIGGGIPERSLTYVSADPSSMAEVFLYQFTQARKTYYFTTGRRKEHVHRDITNLDFDTENITFIDVYKEYYFTPSGEMADTIGNEYVDTNIIQFVEYSLKNIIADSSDEEINIIIDNFSFFLNLSVNMGLIRKLINVLYEITKDNNCLTYLLGLKGSHPENMEKDILHASDVIFDISIERTTDKITSKLVIPKIRGMIPGTDIIKFNIREGIQIDTSKDIA